VVSLMWLRGIYDYLQHGTSMGWYHKTWFVSIWVNISVLVIIILIWLKNLTLYY